MIPLYVSVPKALRNFKLRSMPRTALSTIAVLSGVKKSGSDKNVALTFSISEDYARVWLHFAKKNLPGNAWDFVIVDCAGDMDPKKFHGADLVKFANISHGKKIDVFLYKYLKAPIVFLCDDDKYILSDLAPAVHELDNPRVAAVSLSPRDWYKVNVNGKEFFPMGSYAVMLKRDIITGNKLSFQSVNKEFKSRVVEPGIKKPFGYDCADYANEQLLKLGYEIITDKYRDYVLGFDGLSTPRVFLIEFGKKFVLDSLSNISHYKKGSTNGVIARVLYGITKFEELFRHIFKTEPKFSSGLDPEKLRNCIQKNMRANEIDKEEVLSYYNEIESLCNRLKSLA